MPDHYIPDGVIITGGGKILDFGRKLDVPQGAEIYDAKGLFVGPGLIDIHTHAGCGHWFYEEPEVASKSLLAHGVTSVLPVLYFNFNKEQYLKGLDTINECVDGGSFPNFLGFYMEGPYLNPKFGADKANNPWQGPISPDDYVPIVDKAGERAKVWCVAPEREGILDFVKYAKSKNPAAVFSVAHSEANPEQIEALMPYGLKSATHHLNATGTLEAFPECRSACVDETVYYNDDLYAELISDFMGIHVQPYLQRLTLKSKGRDRVILISDACVFDGPPIPGCEDAFDICFDFGGDIAGSKLTLDVACANIMRHTGASVCDAFRMASRNPARLLSLSDVGEIKRGNAANLVIVDHWFNIKDTILKGELL